MSFLIQKIQKKLIEAKKSGDSSVRILSVLKSEIELAQINNNRKQLTDFQIMGIVQSLIKRINDAIALYKKAGRQDLLAREEEDLKFLKEFLPKQLSKDELNDILRKLKSEKGFTTIKDYIDYMNKNYPAQFDTRTLVSLLKENGYV